MSIVSIGRLVDVGCSSSHQRLPSIYGVTLQQEIQRKGWKSMLFMNGALALTSVRLSSLSAPKQAIGLFGFFHQCRANHYLISYCISVCWLADVSHSSSHTVRCSSQISSTEISEFHHIFTLFGCKDHDNGHLWTCLPARHKFSGWVFSVLDGRKWHRL